MCLRCVLGLFVAFATTIVGPAIFRCLDGLLLALLGTAAQEYDESISVLAEIDPVPRSGIDFSLEDSSPNALHVRPITCRQLIKRRCDLCDATALSPSNHVAKGERACGSRYSSTRTSGIVSNEYVTITHCGMQS